MQAIQIAKRRRVAIHPMANPAEIVDVFLDALQGIKVGAMQKKGKLPT
jgi:hypothetical protein